MMPLQKRKVKLEKGQEVYSEEDTASDGDEEEDEEDGKNFAESG